MIHFTFFARAKKVTNPPERPPERIIRAGTVRYGRGKGQANPIAPLDLPGSHTNSITTGFISHYG